MKLQYLGFIPLILVIAGIIYVMIIDRLARIIIFTYIGAIVLLGSLVFGLVWAMGGI